MVIEKTHMPKGHTYRWLSQYKECQNSYQIIIIIIIISNWKISLVRKTKIHKNNVRNFI